MRHTRTTALAAAGLVATALAGCAPATGAGTASGDASSTPAATSASAASASPSGSCTVQITGPTIAGGELLATVTTACTSGAGATGSVSFTRAPAGTSVNTLTGWAALPGTHYWNGMPPTANLTAPCSAGEWVVVAETQTNAGPATNTESTPVTVTAAQCG